MRYQSRLAPAPVLASLFLACTAVYPEVTTPTHAARPGASLSPAPPDDMLFVRFASATIPAKTRDGRSWDAVGGSAPDPFAKLMVDDVEILRTPVQSNTLVPTWPDAPRLNYRIAKGSVIRVELWDSNPINNHPICVKVLRDFFADARAGSIDIECDSGAHIQLLTEPAHPIVGLGFRYEFRTTSVHITRIVAESPARRAGLKEGDEIVKVQGKEVKALDEGELRSLINSNAPTGVTLSVKRDDGSTVELTLKDGPIYPVEGDDIPVH